jgi:peptide/nickel transport system permease protein
VTSLGYVAWRSVWSVVAVLLVLSAVFVLVAGTLDPTGTATRLAAAVSGESAAAQTTYEFAMNRNVPLVDRYVRFMTDFATLQWGGSYETDRAVTAMVLEGTFVTSLYLVPSVVLAVTGAVLAGLYASVRESRALDLFASTVSYAGVGIPNFWLAAFLSAVLAAQFGIADGFALSGAQARLAEGNPADPLALVAPVAVLTTTLFGTMFRYVRSEFRDQFGEQYVKTARSKGLGTLGIARHALRNAALPLVSLVFAELLGVLFLGGFIIEVVFDVHGLMDMAYLAIQRRDLPVVVGTALVPVVVGIVGNFLQDLTYTVLDPRVGFGESAEG